MILEEVSKQLAKEFPKKTSRRILNEISRRTPGWHLKRISEGPCDDFSEDLSEEILYKISDVLLKAPSTKN